MKPKGARALPAKDRTASRSVSLRQINARNLYVLLRANSPCSRADLMRLSGLSGPTVSRTIDYLEKRGLVVSLGFGESDGGRPPDQLSLNQDYLCVAGVEIKKSGLRVALADLKGNPIAQWASQLPAQTTPEKVVRAVLTGVENVLHQRSIPKKRLASVCTSAPGIIDDKTGYLIFAPFLKDWGEVPLRELLEGAFNIPVSIDNESNLHALGERAYGAASEFEHFVFLEVGDGIGAGIFLNGMLYRGASGAAGEIGYLQLPSAPRGPLSAHVQGNVEQIAGGKGMEVLWRAQFPNKPATAAEILTLAEEANPVALRIIDRAARVLSDVVANIAALLDPPLIVLGGPCGSSPALFAAVTRHLRLAQHDADRIRLRASICGKDGAILGALKTALENAEQRLLRF